MVQRYGRVWWVLVPVAMVVLLGAVRLFCWAPSARFDAESSRPAVQVGSEAARRSTRAGRSPWLEPAIAGVDAEGPDSPKAAVSAERKVAAKASGELVRYDPETGSEMHFFYGTDGGLMEQVEYDRDQRIVRRVQRVTTEDHGGIVESRYNDDGSLTMRCDYDMDGRLKGRLRYDSGELLERIEYDDFGRLTVRMEYDENGAVVAEGKLDAEGRFHVVQELAGTGERARLESVYDETDRLLEEWEIDEQGVAHGKRYDPRDYASLEKWVPSFNGLFKGAGDSDTVSEEEFDAEGDLRRKRTYDGEGLLREDVQFHEEDDTWTAISYRFNPSTDQPGSLQVFDDEGKLLRYVKYDAQGFVLNELIYDEAQAAWVANDYSRDPKVNHPRSVRTYDSSGALSREESYDFRFEMRSLQDGETAGEWLDQELHVGQRQADVAVETTPWHIQTYSSALGVTGLRYDEETGETVVDLDLNDERLGHAQGEVYLDLAEENIKSDLVGKTVGISLDVPEEFVGGWIHIFGKEGIDWKTEYSGAHPVTEPGVQTVEYTFEKAFSGDSRVVGVSWYKSDGYQGKMAIMGIDWGWEAGDVEDLDEGTDAAVVGSENAHGLLSASGLGTSKTQIGDEPVVSGLASGGHADSRVRKATGLSVASPPGVAGSTQGGWLAPVADNASVGYVGGVRRSARPPQGHGEELTKAGSRGGRWVSGAMVGREAGQGQAEADNAPVDPFDADLVVSLGGSLSDAVSGDRDSALGSRGLRWMAAPISAAGVGLLLGLLGVFLWRVRRQRWPPKAEGPGAGKQDPSGKQAVGRRTGRISRHVSHRGDP